MLTDFAKRLFYNAFCIGLLTTGGLWVILYFTDWRFL